ncbi:MAG: 5-bromo-4-chloroindolyl phosphate hydrolysis family protein [Bacteroidales bacterium]|nr:5-bromo-4-chloroindolyl phosphate hydrolysis family protein [Lachnoclostridium sp.]MCM1384345.1 5-bromo-4-chloroindolyl phosphate hydrolysis family protein [Lachnoclostridium sp.]MCM1464926.1 5-bromo-4-chloroindolyl phosphate hydrolysis family protein [Bacteroidales bacterium]
MSGSHNQNHMGEQIKDALSDALQSGDFKNLNSLVSQTVTDTLNEVSRQIAQGTVSPQDIPIWKQRAEERERKKQAEIQKDWQEKMQRRQERFRQQEQRRQQEELTRQGSANALVVRKKSVGSVSGVLYQVFGGIGMGITGFAMFARLLLFLTGASVALTGWLINLLFLSGFAGMTGLGVSKIKRLKRADRYIRLCGSKMYEDIEKIAKGIGKSCKYVKRDIHKMLKAGMFPEGHLDEQKTCFMLNDAVYGQYLELERNRKLREEEEKKAASAGDMSIGQNSDGKPSENTQENELNAMVSEGMDCIRRLRNLNDHIEGEVISDKLFRLENLLKEIFDGVREHPEQMHRMHKLMDYYLPTTLKLVEAYEEFDGISVPGEEVLQAKAEIEKTLDIINQAFAELLNNLFRDAAFDATTDAQVLKSMLAREGLTKEMELAGQRGESEQSE